MSFAAKWANSKKVIYHDQRSVKNIENDKGLLRKVHKLLNEADVVVSHNGKKFDTKRLNARFVLHGFKPPSPFRQIDTLTIVRKHFDFTSNKLAYLTEKICKKFKKSSHAKFSGLDLWLACMKGNPAAWREMEKYNRLDVLSLEELLGALMPWEPFGFNAYHESPTSKCDCGHTPIKRGYAYNRTGKFQKFQCINCGAWSKGSKNLTESTKRRGILRPI